MNRRSKKPPVTPAEGPCPEGLKAFDVTVVETFNHHYIVYAKDERSAEEIAEERCNSEEFSPSNEPDSEYDRKVSAEETELRVVDLKPDGHIKWQGTMYPFWILRVGRSRNKVSTLALQNALFTQMTEECSTPAFVNSRAAEIDAGIAFYVGNDEYDTVDAVLSELKSMRKGRNA